MRYLKAALAAVVLAGVVAVMGAGGATAQGPGPSAGEMLVDGLLQPKGMAMGPDGMLYVAESGTGGDQTVTLEGAEVKYGLTGRVSKVDPATGTRTTVVDGLPSTLGPEGDAVGPADVAFIGNQLYYLQTHGTDDWGFTDWATGIYRVASNGDLTLIADLGAFNKANPTEAISSGTQQDVEPGGNPYAMIVSGGVFYVTDGNHNHLLRATTDGDVSAITEFPNHPVSTGITRRGTTGPFYVAYLGPGPFLPSAGKVVTVGATEGNITEIASGASMLTDVDFGPNGQLYALQFNDTVQAGESLFAPFTGKVLRVNADGTFTPIVTGLTFTAMMTFSGNTLFVNNDSLNALGTGQIWKIENFTSIQPPAAPTAVAPTATPRTGVTAPDTGTGGYGDSGGAPVALLALLVAAIGAVSIGGAFAVRRSRG